MAEVAEAVEVPQSKSKSKSKSKKEREGSNLEAIQAEVASFAAQLGLASSGGFGAGFDDSDFRKTGRIGEKAPKKSKQRKDAEADEIVAKSPGGKGKKAGKSEDFILKGKDRKSKGKSVFQELGLGFDSSEKPAAVGEKGKGKKRSWPSDTSGQGDEKSAKKERLSEGGPKNDTPGAGKFVASLDKSLAKSFQSASLWYEGLVAAAANPKAKSSKDVAAGREGDDFSASKRKEAEQLMEKAVADYEKSRSKDSDTRWLMTARRSGTSSDKVAAMTVMLQDNPMLNLRTLDALLGMVTSKGGKRHAVVGVDALRELFLRSLLPDRKLKYLNQQPLSTLADSKEGSALLLYWYFEDCLKRRYERFVSAIEEATKDTLPFLKEKALKTVFDLLKTKPEQERRLLSALVNKLGDPERKVASNASYLLSCLLTTHPVMKAVVVAEVDSFLFRPHVGNRARYYAAVFLNQIMLFNKGDGPKIAKQLINLYFALFRTVTLGDADVDSKRKGKKKKVSKYHKKDKKDKKDKKSGAKGKHDDDTPVGGEVNTRLLSALLTGVNRAFPYVASDDVDSVIEEHTPVLFRLVHSDNFNVAVQALMLLHQLLLKNQAVSDRFYRALYSVLLSPGLTTSNKAEMFLNLLFKALKGDINLRRMAAFAKRLTQVALQQPPNFACGCLLVLSEVLKAKPSLWDGILQPESKDDEMEHFVDVPDEGPSDTALDTTPGSNSETGGAPLDKSESDSDAELGENDMVGGSVPDLEDDGNDSSSDEEGNSRRKAQKSKNNSKPNSSKVEREVSHPVVEPHVPKASDEMGQKSWPIEDYYDSRHRDPSFCNADKACWWELTALANHLHPSVASMARTLLSGANVVYSGDPLRDLVLGAFLDRFAEKKPKARKEKEDGSMAMSGTDKTIVKRLVGEELLALDENEVAPEDVVFHKFYQTKVSKRQAKKAKNKKDDEDDDITGLGEVDGMDGDDSEEDEVDTLLEQEEGREMGSAGEEDSEDGDESEGEFDYDKLEPSFNMEEDEEDEDVDEEDGDESEGEFVFDKLAHTFDLEEGDEDAESDEEDSDISPKKKKKGSSDILPEKKKKKKGSSDILPEKKKKKGSSDILPEKKKKKGSSDILPEKKKKKGSSDILPEKKKKKGSKEKAGKRTSDTHGRSPFSDVAEWSHLL